MPYQEGIGLYFAYKCLNNIRLNGSKHEILRLYLNRFLMKNRFCFIYLKPDTLE